MQKIILKIDGMSCSACQATVEKYLNKQVGVKATVNLVMAQALIEYDESKVSLNDLNRFVSEAGYKSLGIYDENSELKKDYSKYYLLVFAVLGIILMYISMSHMLGLPVISFLHMRKYPVYYGSSLLVLTIPFLIYGMDIIQSGIKKLFYKSPNMDTLVMIGILSSFIYSLINFILVFCGEYSLVESLYFESVAMIIYFIKLGRYIELKSKEKTKSAIQDLVMITPEKALLKVKNGEKEVTTDEVKVGDILICKPGMKVAVDGIIVYGETHLDESFITGESKHEKRHVQDKVIAGSINIDGYIEYRAVKIGKDSMISEIVRLVMESVNTKAPIQKMVDKVSSYFVPGIMLIACLTFIFYLLFGNTFQDSIVSFVTVLVVACPCALGLATPLAVVVSGGRCAKEGILVKSSEVLERAYKTSVVVFDKTGTLTYGNLRISKIYNYSNYSDKELIQIVASLEKCSSHPISLAFSTYACEKKLKLYEVSRFHSISGIGLSGFVLSKQIFVGNNKLLLKKGIYNVYQEIEYELSMGGNSIVYVVEAKKIIAVIGIKDIVRSNVKNTIHELKRMHKRVVMLSGDHEKTAHVIADGLGLDDVVADCVPQDKKKYLSQLQKKGEMVMMVGDGINDAPSLASADIGISVNSGTDIAANSSDVILINDNIEKIVDLICISKKTVHIIRENLFWAFFYNICMIPIAIGLLRPFGIVISPMLASIFMTISSLTVVFNSLRLRK